jgi:hypothetical protein
MYSLRPTLAPDTGEQVQIVLGVSTVPGRPLAKRRQAAEAARQQLPKVAGGDPFSKITPLQAVFVRHMLAGKSGTEAYILTHPGCGRQTAHSNSYKWKSDPRIQLAIEHGRRIGLAEAVQTKQEWQSRLIQREQQSVDVGQMVAAAKLLELQGKSENWIDAKNNTPDHAQLEPGEFLLQIRARFGSEAASLASKGLGLQDFSVNDAAPVIVEGQAVEVQDTEPAEADTPD